MQCLREIVLQIVRVFKTDGQAQEAIVEPRALDQLMRHLCMGLDDGIGEETLDAAEALSERDELQMCEDVLRNRSCLHLKGDHAAESFALALLKGEARMIGETRIVDVRNLGQGGQPLCDRKSAL